MPEFLSSLTRPKLDTTLIIDLKDDSQGPVKPANNPLFALVSLNVQTSPSAEIPWSQLLALSLTPEEKPVVMSLGRHKDCSVQLEDPRVSLRHFEIVAKRTPHGTTPTGALAYECFLNDYSSNGTSINGKTIGKGNSEKLRSGDEIVVLPSHRVGHDSMISFLFRNMMETFETPKEVQSLDLDELVVCPICMMTIYKCVALMPCFHNFCMACYSQWMDRQEDCPTCRRSVTCIIKNHPMEAVIEAFLEAMPERRRTPEELQEMDSKDRLKLGVGGKIVREICSVGTTSPTTVVPTAANSVGRQNIQVTIPQVTIPQGRAGRPVPTPIPASPAAAGGTTPTTTTTREIVRPGSQVCSVQ